MNPEDFYKCIRDVSKLYNIPLAKILSIFCKEYIIQKKGNNFVLMLKNGIQQKSSENLKELQLFVLT